MSKVHLTEIQLPKHFPCAINAPDLSRLISGKFVSMDAKWGQNEFGPLGYSHSLNSFHGSVVIGAAFRHAILQNSLHDAIVLGLYEDDTQPPMTECTILGASINVRVDALATWLHYYPRERTARYMLALGKLGVMLAERDGIQEEDLPLRIMRYLAMRGYEEARCRAMEFELILGNMLEAAYWLREIRQGANPQLLPIAANVLWQSEQWFDAGRVAEEWEALR